MNIKWKQSIALLLLISAYAYLLIAPTLSATVNISGTTNAKEMLIVKDQEGKVVGVYPSDFYVEHVYSTAHGTNETGVVSYKVNEKKWWWVYPSYGIPTWSIFIPELNAWVRLKSDVSFDVVAGNNVTAVGNTTYTLAGIAILFSVKTYIYFETAPTQVGDIDIGYYLFKYAFNGMDPIIGYYTSVTKYINNEPVLNETYSDIIVLDYKSLKVSIHTVELYVKNITKTQYKESGDLDTGALLQPLYNMTVCGNVIGSSRVYEFLVVYADREAVLRIDGDAEPECTTLNNLFLLAGVNQSVVITVKSGVFTLTLNYTKDVEGATFSIGRATGVATGTPGKWSFAFTIPVYVSGYYSRWPAFSVTGTVVGAATGTIQCETLQITSQGSYNLMCNKTVSYQGTTGEILGQSFTATVTIVDEFGELHEFSGTVLMNAFDPSNVADIAWQAYSAAQSLIAGGMVFVVILMAVSILKEAITGTPLIDPVYLRGVLLTLVVALALLVIGIPYLYGAFTEILSRIPMFQSYVSGVSGGDPRSVFTSMIGYYDKLFAAIEEDYQIRYVGNIQNILNSLRNIIIAFLAIMLIVLAIAAGTAWFGGQIAALPFASIGGTLISIFFAYLGLLLMVTPVGAVVLVGIAVGRIVVLIVTVIATAVMTIGLFMLAIPSPLSQRLGEDMFGSGLLYFIVFPILGPISYTLYKYVIDTSVRGVQEAINIPIGSIVSFFIPIRPLAEIMIFFIASGAVVLMIILSLGYVLSRSGIAAGLGEALSSIVWRG